MADRETDLLIIGAGIVGLATALQVTRRFPKMRVLVVEKEDHVAAHQTGHNSGVIHSGLYYKTGSLKARNCVAGAASVFIVTSSLRMAVYSLSAANRSLRSSWLATATICSNCRRRRAMIAGSRLRAHSRPA